MGPGWVFLLGASYEAAAVVWVHYSERRAPARAAAASAMCATCLVLGLEASLRSGWAAGAFVAGYAAGTYLAVRFRP